MRTELFHPLSVHFPIALTILLLLMKFIELILINNSFSKTLNKIFYITLTLTLISTFISMYLGDMAFDELKGKICKISLVDLHEDYSRYFVFSLFFLFLINTMEIVFHDKLKLSSQIKILVNLIFLLPIVFYLFKTAHSGANLVYDHGVAVLNSIKNCQ